MKRVAFISDIHSNIPALEATISDIKNRSVDIIYCLGDVIGYHSFPNEVIEQLQREEVITIMGNHDLVITQGKFDRNRESDFVLWWNYDALTLESMEYLKNLPEYLEFTIEGVSFKIVHGSPESIEEYIREGSEEVKKYLDLMDHDILLCGHTHIPYIIEDEGRFLLNSGSVGKPKIGRPEASYILVELERGEIKPEIVTLPYDVEYITRDLREKGFPEKYAIALETGNP